jgi:hypothetical protein
LNIFKQPNSGHCERERSAQALVGEGVRTVFADVNRDTLTAAVKTSPRPGLAVAFVGDLASRDACDLSPLASKVEKRPLRQRQTRVLAVWVPAFAGTTR